MTNSVLQPATWHYLTETDQPKRSPMDHLNWRTSSRCGNQTCVEIATTDRGAMMRDSKLHDSPILAFATGRWQEFLAGVRDGEFDRPR
jgi:hypothetical protein